jgi:mono/diheme cytochrome c family protein
MRRLVAAIAITAPFVAVDDRPAQGREVPSHRVDRTPARLAAGVEVADAAIGALQRRLSARLLEELQKGGPAQAIAVCRDEAQALTAETARAQGIRIGRTSHRLRNPGNAAPPWAEHLVAAGAGSKAASVEAAVVDLGDRVGVVRPIATAAMCLQCHGPEERLSPEVRDFLGTAYPDDRAVGFAEGDLRGFLWAEAPVQAAPAPLPASPKAEAGDCAKGEDLFAQANPRCTVCHSVAGKGNPLGPLDGVGDRLSRDEIKAWLQRPAEMAKTRATTRKPAMVPYPEFSDEELDALVAYLATLKPIPQRK